MLTSFANGYSPLLSLLTGLFEVGVAVWALTGPGRIAVLRPVAALLVCLAGYQFLEILVCNDPEAILFARLGFIDVVWLPPLGLWLVAVFHALDGRASVWPRRIALATFAIASGLSVWIAVDRTFVATTVCDVVIASYKHGSDWHHLYGALYELGLGGIVFGGIWQSANLDDPVLRRHAGELAAGTAAFMVLAMLTQIVGKLDPSLPSLMCHYALILAVLLASTVRRERRGGF